MFAAAENQPHRADVSKLLVLRDARRQGLGERLMRAVEAEALAVGRTVLVLDTATVEAERVYERAGWTRLGVLPDYALMPDGSLCDTVFYYKRLESLGSS
jgi:GNAT superfamily N-acetyltransferase